MALLGYARISTSEQDVRGQHDQLEAAGCTRIWTDPASGALAKRPQLDALLDYADEGDTISSPASTGSAAASLTW